MSSRWAKVDLNGNVIHPGDVCTRVVRTGAKATLEYCVYKGESWGGSNSKGVYGRFISQDGTLRSIKYTSVLLAFDPMGERRAQSPLIRKLVKIFYEGE